MTTKLDNGNEVGNGTPNWTTTTDLDKGKPGSLKCRFIIDPACMRAIAYSIADRKRNDACESLMTWWVASQNVLVTHETGEKK